MTVFADHVELLPTTAATPDSRVIARFTIYGNPVPKARARVTSKGTFTPKQTVIAERAVLAAFRSSFPGWVPVEHGVELTCTFYRDSRRIVDLDNLVKTIQDALNRVAFKDDSQVVDLHSHKFFTTKERARTEVIISMVPGDRIETAA